MRGTQSAPGHVAYTDARYPMICVEFHGAIPDPEWAVYLEKLQATQDRAHDLGDRLVLVVDTLHATRAVTAHQRKLQAEQIAFNAPRNVMAGMAAVIDSALIRGALTALMWIQRFDWEHTVVATRAEAERWALACLARDRKATRAT